MTLEALLERWAEVEPERCKQGAHSMCWRLGRGWCDLLDVHHQAFLLSAVMEAIESRRWAYGLTHRPHSKIGCRHYAYVVTPNHTYQAPDSGSPAEALLTAHLSAIEATEGQPA